MVAKVDDAPNSEGAPPLSTPLLPLPRMLPTRFPEPWRFFKLPSEQISTRDEAAGRTERTIQRPSADVVCVEVSREVKEGRGVLPEFESEPSPPLGLPPRKPKALPFCARSERVDAAATCAQDVACARSGRRTGEKQTHRRRSSCLAGPEQR